MNAAGQASHAVVFYDGHCGFCCRTAAWIKRLDWFGSVEARSFRHDDSYRNHGITLAALEGDMHVAAAGMVFEGFDAVIELARRLPLLWPAVPVFLLLGQAGLGSRMYRLLADNRVIIGDSRSCNPASECSTTG